MIHTGDVKQHYHLSHVLVICSLLWLSPVAGAEENEKRKGRLIDHFILQSAGYVGFVAVGIGKDYRHQRHQIHFLLGYLPDDIGGVDVWQLSFKYDWHPTQRILLGDTAKGLYLEPFYLGLSIIYGYHDDLFVNEPSQYPDDYYSATALRYTLNFGAALHYERYTVYLEYTALDTGLVSYIKNPDFFMDNYDYLGLEGIGSLAIGVKYAFD